MIQKIKDWLSANKKQFTLFTKVGDGYTTICVHLHKCDKVVNIGERYGASWHRGLAVIFLNPHQDNIHIEYVIVNPVGDIHSEGVIQADDIRFNKGVFRVYNYGTEKNNES